MTPSEPFSMRRWFEHYRLVILAMLGSLTLHGSLLLTGSYRNTYDAYVHIFFADHYARRWWDLWEPRWYTGFTMVSYPPLTHQLTALLSNITSLTGGFSIVMLLACLTNTLGIYRFSRLWVEHRPATYAALLLVFSSSIAETVHVFGQLPTMFVMGVMLNALPFVWRWVEDGTVWDLARGWALLMVAAAGHHVTTLFGMVFFSGPILATLLLKKFRTPRLDEPDLSDTQLSIQKIWYLGQRRLRRTIPTFIRCGIFGVGLIAILVITVLPYWLWSRSDPITQITIPHSSRDSFLENTPAGLMFFLIPWGMLLLILPYAFYKGFGSKNWVLASSLAMLLLLGTGGTTPIPAFLLRGAFYILTLDRFTFWGTILIMPFAGLFLESLLHGRLGKWISSKVTDLWYYLLVGGLGLGFVALALFTANLTQYRRFQPDPLNMTPIVEFLAKDNHDQWRYMTLGMGDQMAWLSAQTPALNVEGNYHSARRLPEMTSTPVERLDGAKFTNMPGLGSLQQFVTNPQKYHLKYIFVNDAFYEPLLYFTGWHRLGRLENDVQVWERADVPPLPAEIPAQVYPDWQRLMWGTLPVGSLVLSAVVFLVTSLLPPKTQLHDLPILGWLLRVRGLRYWLIDTPAVPLKASEDWQLWKKISRRFFKGIKLEPVNGRVFYALMLGLALVGLVGMGFKQWNQQVASPEAVILRYYDDLDFKRFSDSYSYVQTDLTQTEYLRWLSLQAGLVASFAKLENLYITVTEQDADQVTAKVEAEWLTALGLYTEENEYRLIRTAAGWRIQLDVAAPPIPRETFIGETDLSFYLSLPLSSLDDTSLARGVLDRSLLSISPPRLVYIPTIPIGFTPESYDAARIEGRFEGLLSIVGAVQNQDSYPAQVTLSAILRNETGERLAETNAASVLIHQLLPGEVSPFRIDFTGADATTLLDVDQVASIEVIVQGVPTVYNLERPLTLLNPTTLYNHSTQNVDIPRILMTFFDEQGELIWVESQYLEYAIAPGEQQTFTPPRLPPGLEVFTPQIQVNGPRITPWDASIPIYSLHGYSR